MSEQDLGLKAEIRRLFWGMGFTTRIDVPMRALVIPRRGRSAASVEEYTDLDVLAIGMAPDFRIYTVIADCKTTLKRATERMFWLRGLGDFFDADHAYLVRAGEVPGAVRQLAAKLDLSVVAPDDLKLLQRGHVSSGAHLDLLFEPDVIAAYHSSLTGLDKRLNGLLEYRQFDFWIYDQHVNLQQVIAHLEAARNVLSAGHPVHCALFCDYAWLFTLSIGRAVQHIRRAHLGAIDDALKEYLFGGQLGLREKQRMAAVLRDVTGRKEAEAGLSDVLPRYYPALLELVTRFVNRPQALMPALRYAEWLTESLAARRPIQAPVTFGDRFDPVAAKLLGDVAGFLVAAADLDIALRDGLRSLFEQPSPPVDNDPLSTDDTTSESRHAVAETNAPSSPDQPASSNNANDKRRTATNRRSDRIAKPSQQDELLTE